MTTIAEVLTAAHAHHQRGEFVDAERLYRQVLKVRPAHGETCNLMGVLALQTGRVAEAVELLERAVAAAPDNARYRGNLGSALFTARRYEPALEALAQTVRDDPANFEAYYNLGVTLFELGRFDEAETAYLHCLRLHPGHRGAHNNLGNQYRVQGRYEEALRHLEQAMTVDPNSPNAHYNRALVLLTLGRFAQGWPEYEWRWRCPEFQARHTTHPLWDGRPLVDETLLVHAEQGLGDTMQFIRYLPQVRERAEHVVVEVQSGLVALLRTSGYEALVPQGAALPAFDVQIPMASLPGVFDATPETIPAEVPYLRANQELVAAWRSHFARDDSFKIGITWQGNPNYREDRRRSMLLDHFAPLAALDGVRLYSLQKGPGSEQIAPAKDRFGVVDLGSNIDETTGPFMDSAAIVQCLDLVVTSDTATAHLAGALGVNVWLALPHAPDWRWLAAGDTSPWYPTMRLFRQRKPGDWNRVFADMAHELTRTRPGPAKVP